MSTQQQETLTYFNSSAEEWRLKAEGKLRRVNMIAQRNGAVLRARRKLPEAKTALDLGCGTGELVLDLAATGVQSLGIDFAPDMIRACEEKQRALGVENVEFRCQSIFDFPAEQQKFDIISGLGLIEYLSPEELGALLDRSATLLSRTGRLLIGSRNRLFNLFSLNEYTTMEVDMGTADALLRESVIFSTAPTMEKAIEDAAELAPQFKHPESHPETGIGVSVRYQYTPGELITMMRPRGLKPTMVYPIHYHGMPSAAKKEWMDTHILIADRMHEQGPEDQRLVPWSSSFVIEARQA
jgi:2-polyprenyl-3-methyl-5-hydroxy-6-metoxy-1,4-benzoquinol methylase